MAGHARDATEGTERDGSAEDKSSRKARARSEDIQTALPNAAIIYRSIDETYCEQERDGLGKGWGEAPESEAAWQPQR